MKGNCGNKRKRDREILKANIRGTPLHQRRTLRALSRAIGVPTSTLHHMLK